MTDIERAANAFGLKRERVLEFISAPLSDDNADELFRLSEGDEVINWERAPLDRPHFDRLVGFRTRHYANFGFGVMGLWARQNDLAEGEISDTDELDNYRLVGQWGLQIFDEGRDAVEAVIFLSREFSGRGLGTYLFGEILRRAWRAGMQSVFGVVRVENVPALGLMRRFGAAELGEKTHFGSQAKIFVFNRPPVVDFETAM